MRLLFLTSRLPFPPDRGDRVRVFNFLKRLSSEHDITLVSFVTSEEEKLRISSLKDYCSEVHAVTHTVAQSILAVTSGAWRKTPLQVSYYRSAAMRRKVDEVVAASRFDAAYVHLVRMAPYAHRLGVYRIMDLTDVMSREIEQSLRYRRPSSRRLYSEERSRLERYERRVANVFDEAWLISERDRSVLAKVCLSANLHVVPNGVDLDRFRPLRVEHHRDTLLFVGNMSVLHNIDAVDYLDGEILPLVRRSLPRVRLTVAGADPVRSVRALEDPPAVQVTGFVHDLNLALNRATVFVAPLRFAAGVQNKVIEAMAAGTPVVTTPVVNEGIGAVSGREVLVGNDARSLAEHIVAVCRSPDLRRQLGEAGRRFVEGRFTWDAVAERMKHIENR